MKYALLASVAAMSQAVVGVDIIVHALNGSLAWQNPWIPFEAWIIGFFSLALFGASIGK